MPDKLDLSALNAEWDRLRPLVEAATPDQELPTGVAHDAWQFARDASRAFELAPRSPLLHAIMRWLRDQGLPARGWTPDGSLTRDAAVELMRANWQDPVGFHEGVARVLDIKEEEYEPGITVTLPRSVADELHRRLAMFKKTDMVAALHQRRGVIAALVEVVEDVCARLPD